MDSKDRERAGRMMGIAACAVRNAALMAAGAALALMAAGVTDGWTCARIIISSAGIATMGRLLERKDIQDWMTDDET